MTSYMRKHCKAISRRMSEVPSLKTILEMKLSVKTTPLEEPNRDEAAQEVQRSQDLQLSRNANSENTLKNATTSKNKKTNITASLLQKSRDSSSNSSESTIINTTSSPIPSTTLSSTIPTTITTKSNKNGPDEKYQINTHLLFESSFPGHTFISVHLQRLQHGIYSDVNLHTKHTLHSMSGREKKDGDGDGKCMEYKYEDLAGEKRTPRLEVQRLDGDLEEIFGEVEFQIEIEPKISNILALPSLPSPLPTISRTIGSIHNSAAHTESTRVLGEVGQKFPTEGTLDSMGKVEHEEAIVHGLYNFAKLGGAFEEQVSLPGESVGSRMPEVDGGSSGGGK
ncbi:hypothetical protein H4I95_05156 [Botrytis cinerea]